MWVYHGQRKWIFPLAWKLNIDIEIEHLHARGYGMGLPSPLEGSEVPGWFWDTGLDGRRLGELVYTWTDNVTNIQTLPHVFAYS